MKVTAGTASRQLWFGPYRRQGPSSPDSQSAYRKYWL